MKEWIMKHRRRLILSFIMIISGIVLCFALEGFTGPRSEMWQRVVFILFALGTVLSGLAGIFLGLRGYVGAYIFLLIITLPRALPEPFDRYYIVVYLAAIFALPHLIKRGKSKRNNTDVGTNAETDCEIDGSDESFGVLLVNNIYSGRWYQLTRRGGFVYAYFVGGELEGPQEELISKSGEVPRPLGKKDISFAVDDILSIKVKEISDKSYSRMAVIKTAKRTYRFWERGDIQESFLDFWQALSNEQVLDRESLVNLSEAEPDEKKKEMAGKLIFACGAYLLVVALAWLFLNVPYNLFAVLNLLALPAVLTVYFVCSGEISICEAKKSSKKHSISVLLISSGTALSLRTILDFNILNLSRLLLAAVIIAAVLLIIFLLCSKEWREKRTAFLYIALALLIYSPGAAMQINYLLDYSAPSVEEAIIEGMRVSTGSNSPDSYIIEVSKADGSTQDIEISKIKYESFRPGDSVDVYTYPGFLGIEYVEAE